MFSANSSSASMISPRRFTRANDVFALSSEMIKYNSKKTLFKQITNFKSHQHIIEVLIMLNSDQDVIGSDEFQNLKEIMISSY